MKTLLVQYHSKTEEDKNQWAKLKDSLIRASTAKNEETPQKSFTKFDFVKEEETASKIFMPLKNKITVTSSFGGRINPVSESWKMHNGVDLKANYEPVYAVLDGIVTEAGWDSKGGGNYIKIPHSDRFETSYLHLSQIYYRVGETVKAGFEIARSGNTGNSTGPHLHFAVKEYGKFINPIHFLNDLIKANNLIALSYEH